MSLKVLTIDQKIPKKSIDKIPFRLYKIVVTPLLNEKGTRIIDKGGIHKITGKATYYHTIPVGPDDSHVIFMVIGGDGSAVFEIDADRLGSCTMIGEEDINQPGLVAVLSDGKS